MARPHAPDDGKITPARAAALEALSAVDDGVPADDALGSAFGRRPGMKPEDRGLAHELTYGVLRHRRRLDDALKPRCKSGLPKEQATLDVLRLGAYQLLFLERVPPHAAVSTAVDAVHAGRHPHAAGFVNAVLRAIAGARDAIRAEVSPTPARAHSMPDWLVRALEGTEELPALLAASNEPAPLTLRAKPGDRDRLLADLRASGAVAEPGRHAPDAIRVSEPGSPMALPGFAEGRFAVQDEAAQLVTALLDPKAGERLLDVCAAPGGKAIHAAQLGAIVTAVDADAKRLARVREAAARLGVTLETKLAEARESGIPGVEGEWPKVLVDAPCSATGILRRKPDAKWRTDPKEIARLAVRQNAILAGAAKYVSKGGRLVYAVCSLLPAKGEEVVRVFLAGHGEFAAAPVPDSLEAFRTRDGFFRSRPDVHGTDGFFAAVLLRG